VIVVVAPPEATHSTFTAGTPTINIATTIILIPTIIVVAD